MQLTKTLSIFLLAFVALTSFKPVPVARVQKVPDVMSVYIGNNIKEVITRAVFDSRSGNVQFTNIAPDDGASGLFDYDTDYEITFLWDFATPVQMDAQARINIDGKDQFFDIPAGSTHAQYRIYNVGDINGIKVFIEYK